MNKKLIQFVGAFMIAILPVTVFAVGENAKPRSTTTGLLIGENSSAYIGFNGAARVRQQAATVTAFTAMQNYGLIAAGPDYSVQHVTKALSAANIIAMYTTPVALLVTMTFGV